MITSMTGFGTGEKEQEGVRARVEIRSVNSRFLDIQVRRPASLQEFEANVRERIQKRVGRGKVMATLTWEEGEDKRGMPRLDEEVASAYFAELQQLQEFYGLSGEADLKLMAGLPGIFKTDSEAFAFDQTQQLVLDAADLALDDFEQMRATEGATLEKDLRMRLEQIGERLERIARQAEQGRELTRSRLREKIDSLLQPGEISEERLAVEVAIICERADITEEIVRFRSHNAQFLETIERGGEVGRRLNFLLQEIGREANTISSKASEAEIIHLVVDIKEEVERLREQVQNLA
jgi:uncharacterized protein (TIGR00255 family)